MTLPLRPTAGTPAACVIAGNPISGITYGRCNAGMLSVQINDRKGVRGHVQRRVLKEEPSISRVSFVGLEDTASLRR